MKISSETFERIRIARGLDLATIARRSNIPLSKIEGIRRNSVDLQQDEVLTIADELAVPVSALFMNGQLPLFAAVDFRSPVPRAGNFHKKILKAVELAERISTTLASLDVDLSLDRSLAPVDATLHDRDAIALAGKWRKHWGMSDDQQVEWSDANKLYISLRSYIESLGIFVIHRSFETDEAAGIYAHIDSGPHIIIINSSKSSKARKLFTLAHEFCHVLIRSEGASNPSVLKNPTEKFCNKFAAYLLAPDTLVTAVIWIRCVVK